MAKRLRLGVIGTGGRWRRWRAALSALRGEVTVAAIHGPGEEGERGAVEVARRPDIDAIFLGEAWFGLWPLAHALEAGKPVFCAAAVTARSDLTGLAGNVTFCHWPALSLAEVPFREALAPLGPLRLLQIASTRSGDGTPLEGPFLPPLLLFARSLLGEQAEALFLGDNPACIHLRHEMNRWAQLGLYVGASAPHCRVVAEADAGAVALELPGRLSWRDATGRHTRELPASLAEIAALEAFLRAVRGGEPMEGLDEMRGALLTIAGCAAASG